MIEKLIEEYREKGYRSNKVRVLTLPSGRKVYLIGVMHTAGVTKLFRDQAPRYAENIRYLQKILQEAKRSGAKVIMEGPAALYYIPRPLIYKKIRGDFLDTAIKSLRNTREGELLIRETEAQRKRGIQPIKEWLKDTQAFFDAVGALHGTIYVPEYEGRIVHEEDKLFSTAVHSLGDKSDVVLVIGSDHVDPIANLIEENKRIRTRLHEIEWDQRELRWRNKRVIEVE